MRNCAKTLTQLASMLTKEMDRISETVVPAARIGATNNSRRASGKRNGLHRAVAVLHAEIDAVLLDEKIEEERANDALATTTKE